MENEFKIKKIACNSMKKYLIFKIDEKKTKTYSSVNNLKAPESLQKYTQS